MTRRPARGLLATVVALLLSAAPMDGLAQDATGCSDADRRAQLVAAQQDVLRTVRPGPGLDLTTLRDEADVAALAAVGYGLYDHQQASVRGMGWTVVDLVGGDPSGAPVAGRPAVLFYQPTGENVTHPRDGFDFPYRLRGWAYAAPYRPADIPPILPCAHGDEWFVHEQGIHTFHDGGFVPVPPADDHPRGSRASDCPGPDCPQATPPDYAHGRLWDLHLWLGDPVPTVSMTNPGPKIAGIDPLIGKAFFRPDQ